MNATVVSIILAGALVVASFLVGGRYTVVISDTAISQPEIPYQQGIFIVDRFTGSVIGCTVAACRKIVQF
jgi:hypothetical protein